MTTTAEQRITLSDPVVIVRLPSAQRKRVTAKSVAASVETAEFRWVENQHPRDAEGQFTDKVDVDLSDIIGIAKSAQIGDVVVETDETGTNTRITKIGDTRYQIQVQFSTDAAWVDVTKVNDRELDNYLKGKGKNRRWKTTQNPQSQGADTSADTLKFSYLSDTDAVKMHTEMQRDDPWTFEQEEALREYAGSAYSVMNDFLRGIGDELSGATQKKVRQLITDVNDAMRPTTRDLRVARGVTGLAAFGLSAGDGSDQLSELKKLRGKRVREPGFLSTSTRDSWLETLHETAAELLDDEDIEDPTVVVEVDVPRGTRAAYLAAPGGPGIKSEGELLLASGFDYEFVDVFQRPGEAVTVQLRVVS